MAELPKVRTFGRSGLFYLKRKEVRRMLDLTLREIIFLAVLIVPLGMLMAGLIWVFIYAVGLLFKDMFSHIHFRHRKAH
jgi:hypothetical protein